MNIEINCNLSILNITSDTFMRLIHNNLTVKIKLERR